VLFLPTDRGAVVMVCDDTCFVAVADRLPTVEPMFAAQLAVCCTCYACSLTVPGSRCACASLEVSCSGPSWLLTSGRGSSWRVREGHGEYSPQGRIGTGIGSSSAGSGS
jgi:hypothetical protein